MKLEAIVHPLSISRLDKKFDPNIHIAVEVLRDPIFQKKMIGIPVTAYHHDTIRAVKLIEKLKLDLNATTMRTALTYLHKTLPSPQMLAKSNLAKKQKAITAENIWNEMPSVMNAARGPGVFGSVTRFFCRNGQWLVDIELDTIPAFRKKLIRQNGALGEVSLTHAVVDGVIEPLELSFTIQGLRSGSAINRIVSASRKHNKMETPAPEIPDATDEIRAFYDQLADPGMQSRFLKHMKDVTIVRSSMNAANETRLAELEKAMHLVQEATANALNELGPSCFGNIRQRTPEEWNDVMRTAATTELVLAAAANNLNKRKRETDELDEALKEMSGHRVVAASKAQKQVHPVEDEFFKELRTMRQALQRLG